MVPFPLFLYNGPSSFCPVVFFLPRWQWNPSHSWTSCKAVPSYIFLFVDCRLIFSWTSMNHIDVFENVLIYRQAPPIAILLCHHWSCACFSWRTVRMLMCGPSPSHQIAPTTSISKPWRLLEVIASIQPPQFTQSVQLVQSPLPQSAQSAQSIYICIMYVTFDISVIWDFPMALHKWS